MTELIPSSGPTATRVEVPAGAVASGDFEDLPISVGDVVADRYKVERVLAEGGMGVVYLARHVELGQEVAIKLLRREFCESSRVVARFVEEAKAAAALRSEHVVRVMDVGLLDVRAGAVPYLVMEYLEGTNLGDLVERAGPISVERGVELMLQACDALEAAHGAGIIHRDIKPDNLFLSTSDGRSVLKLVDFGIAKRLDGGGERIVTGPQEFMGSPGFMSPEQITRPAWVDRRTDVFSLGGTFYYVLTGQLPFDGDTLAEVCDEVLYATPTRIGLLRPGVSAELEATLARCLAKERDQRFPSIRALADALLRSPESPVNRSPGVNPVATTPPVTAHERGVDQASRSGAIGNPRTDGSGSGSFSEWDLPFSGPRPGTFRAIAAALVLTAGGLCAAQRFGLVDVRDVTDGTLTPAPMARDAQSLFIPHRGRLEAEPLPLRGVVSDARSPYLVAERERLAPPTEAELAWRREVQRRRRAYRAYLRRNGLTPLREVLAEVNRQSGSGE